MMSEFQVGDKVECIDSNGYNWITKGCIYTVQAAAGPNHICIEVTDASASVRYNYRTNLFKKVEPIEPEAPSVEQVLQELFADYQHSMASQVNTYNAAVQSTYLYVFDKFGYKIEQSKPILVKKTQT